MNIHEAKEKREERQPSFIDSSDEYVTTTESDMRQRVSSYSVESRKDNSSSLGREYRTKSVVSPTRSSYVDSTAVSDLEKTVEMVKVEGTNSDHRTSKEKLVLESLTKVSPVVVKKAMDMKRCRDRPGPLFDDEESSLFRPKQNTHSGTAAAAAAAAAASKTLVSV